MADFWDEQMDAITSQRSLIAPAVERLLGLRSVERMMELARGNGEFARRMSQLGATVLATDFSERMLELARARGRAGHGSDALGEGRELHPPHHWFGVDRGTAGCAAVLPPAHQPAVHHVLPSRVRARRQEPVLEPDQVEPGSTSEVFAEAPGVLVARMRLPVGSGRAPTA